MAADPKNRTQDTTTPAEREAAGTGEGRGRTDQQDTTPAEEWGGRLDRSKKIARGGKEHGTTPGAEEGRGGG